VMAVAVLLPALVGLFLLAMERFEVWAFGPRDSATPSDAPPPHVAHHDGHEADIDRQRAGRGIEGRGPWTHR
jgi:hypothetical protein